MKSEFIPWDKIHNKNSDAEVATENVSADAPVAAPESGSADSASNDAAPNDVAPQSEDPAEKYKDIPVDEDGIRQFITKDMLIGDVIEKYPMAAKALLSVGMHCVTCGVALYESVEEASYVHGLEPDDVIKVVNDILTTELIEHPGEGLQ